MKQKLDCIVLVDDDEPTNFIHKIIIEETNCCKEIIVCEDGRSALQTLQDRYTRNLTLPNIVFLDINMPGMNGWQFLDKYQVLDSMLRKEIVVVMLSTSKNPDDLRKANEHPSVASFCNKPLSEEMIFSLLERYFPSYLSSQ
ncbi:MAG: response regulator [Bacteroidota bacterium]